MTGEMLDISDAEMRLLLAALIHSRVNYLPQATAKRHARRLCHSDASTMTAAQRDTAIRIACRYRRDMPRSVLAILARLPEAAFVTKRKEDV